MIQRLFVTKPNELEHYNRENGDSCSYYYSFDGNIFIMCNLKIPEGYGVICEAVYVSDDINFELGCNDYLGNIPEIKYLSRKVILNIKKSHEKLLNRTFVCLGCGEIIPHSEMIYKNGKLAHHEHYWCDNFKGLKEIKQNKKYLVFHRLKGHGDNVYKEKIELLENHQLKRTRLMTWNTKTDDFYYKYLGYC